MSENNRFSSWEDAVEWLRQQPGAEELVQDCYYDDPLGEAARRYHESAEWREIGRWISSMKGGRALDVGAGRGIASFALASDGFSVVAMEPDSSQVVGSGAIHALATESRLPIHVVEGVSEFLPFEDEVFDIVFTRATLHHTRDLYRACEEFYRVLKPGGAFVAVREHVISRKLDLGRFLEQHPLHALYGGENAFLLKEYLDAMSFGGFRNINVFSPWDTVVNYAPHASETLKDELSVRFAGVGLARPVRKLCNSSIGWRILRKVLNAVDSRPGRLYSFMAVKS